MAKCILDAQNTVASMQAGLVYGYIGQVEYLVGKVKEKIGIPNMKIIATGRLIDFKRTYKDISQK